MKSGKATDTGRMPNENPGLVDSSARARISVIHGLRKAPAVLSVQGRGYAGKRVGQVSIASTFDEALTRPILEGASIDIAREDNGQRDVANTVTFAGGVASSGDMQRSLAYGHETRSAFPYESRRASFDTKRQSVHAALENYGLNCPVPAPPSPMRSKSALGRDLIPRAPRPLLLTSHAGQVDSLFDHDPELFEIPAEAEYRYLNLEDGLPTGVLTGTSLIGKSQYQVHDLEGRTKADVNKRIDSFDICDNEGVATVETIEEIAKEDVDEAESLLHKLKVSVRAQ